jgi:hypothetical protein
MGVINVVNSCMFRPRYNLGMSLTVSDNVSDNTRYCRLNSVRRLFWPRASIVLALDVCYARRSLSSILAWIIISFRRS